MNNSDSTHGVFTAVPRRTVFKDIQFCKLGEVSNIDKCLVPATDAGLHKTKVLPFFPKAVEGLCHSRPAVSSPF